MRTTVIVAAPGASDLLRLAVVFLIAMPALFANAAAVTLPPASSGVINGRTALLVWPTTVDRELLEPTNCAAHMVPYSEPDQELEYPCGVWFQPPVGKYRYWLEKDGRTISPYPTIVYYAGPPFSGSSLRVLLPVVRAGQVALKSPTGSDASFRLLHVPAMSEHPERHRSLDRRCRADSVRPLLMPEGRVIGGLFDAKSGNAIAITKPVQIARDRLVYVDPQKPLGGSDILAVFEREGIRSPDASANASLAMLVDGKEARPDVISDTANRVVAVWYGVHGRVADLVVRSSTEFAHVEGIHLASGRVITVRRQLGRLPALNVGVSAPPAVGPLSIELRSPATHEVLRTASASVGNNRIELLPPEKIEVALHVRSWTLTRIVDLTAGRDGSVLFNLTPIEVHGRVFVGDQPTSGRIVFFAGTRSLTETRARDDGSFNDSLWSAGTYQVQVTVPGREPYIDPFVSIDAEHSSVDFHVPDNSVTVNVIDAKDHRAIPKAFVTVTDEWADEYRQIETRQTDESGAAILPPLKPGHVSIDVRAVGYASAPPERLEIDDQTTQKDVTVELRRASVRVHVTIVAPDGSPALGADLGVIAAVNDDRPLWGGKYDDVAGVDVPLFSDAAILLVRERGAASAVTTISRDSVDEHLQLRAEAPPLTIRTIDSNGMPVASARVAVWYGPYRMTTLALGFLTWSQPAISSSAGTWVARGLPQEMIKVLAWRPQSVAAFSGALDVLASAVPYPWPPDSTLACAD